jgi:tape measure domain-containing protein
MNAGKLNATMGGLGGILKGGAFAAAGAGVLGLGKAMVEGNAEMENYTSRFTVMLGSVEKTRVLMDELKEFGESTPYEFPELAQASSSLLAFGFNADQIKPNLQKLGDIASGVGTDFNELSSIYGKARIAGTLMTEDINQLTERGIPVIQEFAKQLGVSEGQVKEMASQGRITFPMLEQAFTDLTAEGGKFNGMMEAQSQTFTGMLSTVQDVAGGVLRELGGPLFNEVKTVLGDLTKVLQGPEIATAVQALGGAIGSIMKVVGSTIGQVLPLVLQLLTPLANLIANVLEPVSAVLGVVLTNVAGIIQGLVPPLTGMLNLVGGLVNSVIMPLVPVLAQISGALIQALTPIFVMVTDVVKAITPLLGMIGQVVGSLVPLLNPVITLVTELAPILTQITAPITQLIGSLAQLATTLLGALLPVLTPLVNIIATVVSWLVGGLAKGLGAVLGFVVELAAGLVTLVADGLNLVIEGIVAAVTWIGDIGSQIIDFLQPAISGLTDFLGFLYDMLIGAVIGVLQEVFGWFQTLGAFILDVLSPGIDFLTGVFDTVAGAISAVISWVSGAVTSFLKFTGVIDGAKSTLGFFGQAVEVVKRAIAEIANIIRGAEAGFNSLKETVAKTWTAIKEFRVGDALSEITSGVPDAVKAASDSGKALATVQRGTAALGAEAKKQAEAIRTAGRQKISSLNLAAKATADQVRDSMEPVLNEFRKGFNTAPDAATKAAYAGLIDLAKRARDLRIQELEKAKETTKETTKAGAGAGAKKTRETKPSQTPLQLAQEELKNRQQTLDTTQATAEADKARARLAEGREETVADELVTERDKLGILQKQLTSVQELLKFDATTKTFGIKLDAKKGETQEDAQRILNEAIEAVNTQLAKVRGLQVTLLPEIDPNELAQLEQETLELNIRLGTAEPLQLEEFIQGDISRLEGDLAALGESRKAALADQLKNELITQTQHDEAMARVIAGSEQEQMELRNRISGRILELRDMQYDREIQQLEARYALEDELRDRQQAKTEAFMANLLRAADNLGNVLVGADFTERRSQLDRDRELELVSQEAYEARKTELETEAANKRAALEAAARGRELELARQSALEQLSLDQQRLKDRQEVARKAGRTEEVAQIGLQLDQVARDMDAKGSVLLGVGEELQGSLTELVSNLFAGDPEAIKNPFRAAFGVLAGALQRLASAKITEALLGMINGITGLPGVLLAFASRPLIEGLVNAVLTPVLSGLLSFPTGGRIDAPTLALLGDASRLGGRNTEWIFRDEQLQDMLQSVVVAGQRGMLDTIQDMAQGIWALVDSDVVARGTELVRVTDNTRHRTTRRIINPNRGA